MTEARLDLDSYLSWMRVTDQGKIMHLGCVLTPAGARLAADRLRELADEADERTSPMPQASEPHLTGEGFASPDDPEGSWGKGTVGKRSGEAVPAEPRPGEDRP